MNTVQKSFKQKIIGFWALSLFFVFMVFGLCTVKAFSQSTMDMGAEEPVQEGGIEAKK